jgi:16S rRNA (uracil1498-N3)-methyltransferase
MFCILKVAKRNFRNPVHFVVFSNKVPDVKSRHKLPRIFEEIKDVASFSLSEENSHHLVTVMRMQSGHYFRAFNTNGEYLCIIDNVSSPKLARKLSQSITATASVVEIIRVCEERQLVTSNLFVSPIRSRNMKKLVEMVTELGVTTITPVLFQNTNAKLDSVESLQRTAIGAAEQSERLSVPEILEPITLTKLVSMRKLSVGCNPLLVCRERSLELSVPILSCLSRLLANNITRHIDVMVGPEGGFIESEMETMRGLDNIYMVSLESNVLRTETAATVAMGCIRNVLLCNDRL